MVDSTLTLEKNIPSRLLPGLEELSARLRDIYGDKLLGLTLYGAALEDGAGPIPAQTIMVLEGVDLAPLRRLAQHAAMFGSKGLAAPLAMTPQYIDASLDTFPLELIEIQQHHVTLAGRDFFESLDIRPEHVRLQCEREFKRILMRIRQGVLFAADHEHMIGEMLTDIGQHILRALRGMLWMRKVTDYRSRDSVLGQCAQIVGRPLTGVSAAMRIGGAHGWSELEALYDDVEALAVLANSE